MGFPASDSFTWEVSQSPKRMSHCSRNIFLEIVSWSIRWPPTKPEQLGSTLSLKRPRSRETLCRLVMQSEIKKSCCWMTKENRSDLMKLAKSPSEAVIWRSAIGGDP